MRTSVTDGHPSERPTRELSEQPAAAEAALRSPIRSCSGQSLPRFTPPANRRHRHCGAGPRLTADGRYPLTCSMELGLSSDAAFRPVRPRPSSRLQDGHSTRFEHVFETWSSDSGRSWSPVTLTSLPNPSAGTDAVTLRDGRHLIVYNHTPKGRTPLNVALSPDGKTWEPSVVLEDQPGEYSYPAVIQSVDGLVHVTYTWKREKIKHVVLDPTKLESKEMVSGEWPKK